MPGTEQVLSKHVTNGEEVMKVPGKLKDEVTRQHARRFLWGARGLSGTHTMGCRTHCGSVL